MLGDLPTCQLLQTTPESTSAAKIADGLTRLKEWAAIIRNDPEGRQAFAISLPIIIKAQDGEVPEVSFEELQNLP